MIQLSSKSVNIWFNFRTRPKKLSVSNLPTFLKTRPMFWETCIISISSNIRYLLRLKKYLTRKNNNLKILSSPYQQLKNTKHKDSMKPQRKPPTISKLSLNFNSRFLIYFRRLQNLKSHNVVGLYADRINHLNA